MNILRGVQKVKAVLGGGDALVFLAGAAIYLIFLFLIQVLKLDLVMFALVFAPFSILGMATEVFDNSLSKCLIVVFVSFLQGALYLFLYRILLKVWRLAAKRSEQ